MGANEPQLHGVSFAISDRLLESTNQPVGVSERIMTLQLGTTSGRATIICAYAPTLKACSEEKDSFYEQLNEVIRKVDKRDSLFLIGDFNARIGVDCESRPTCLGNYNMGKMNENGQRLLELCSQNELCVTNTFFQLKPQHYATWQHPRSGHWHQLDYVITKRASLNTVKSTRAFHGADCDTDHILVISRIEVARPVRCPRANCPKQSKKVDTSGIKNSEKLEKFAKEFSGRLNHDTLGIEDTWSALKDAIHGSALEAFGTRKSFRHDWMAESADKIIP